MSSILHCTCSQTMPLAMLWGFCQESSRGVRRSMRLLLWALLLMQQQPAVQQLGLRWRFDMRD
jgi:hypothetical protein